MKALRSAAGLAAGLLVAGFPFLALSWHDGAPAGFSGPGQYCNACHYVVDYPTPVNSGTGSVTITAPETFTPGVPVTITVHVTNTTPQTGPERRTGFQVSVRDAAVANTYVGAYTIDTTKVRLAPGDTRFVTHTSESILGSTWTFQWTAPTTGSPAGVTIYAAGNATDGNETTDGDYVYSTTHAMTRVNVATEGAPDALALALGRVAPNPVRGTAEVALTLPQQGHVVARLLDVQGREVRRVLDETRPAGAASLRVETAGLAEGPYVLEVTVGTLRTARSLTVAR